MRELLISLSKNEKMAILISSHNLAELDNLCNKICIIKNGEIIETSEISEIKNSKENKQVTFEIENTQNIQTLYKNAKIINSTTFKLEVEKQEIPQVIEKLVENKIKIYEVRHEEKTLEDAFFERTGGNVIE